MKEAGHWWCGEPGCRRRQLACAISRQAWQGRQPVHERWFVPLPLQAEFYERRAPRKLWGGAAGPGKSFGARRLALRKCLMTPGLNVLLLRKTFPELERTHIKALRREADDLGFTWSESRKTAEFPTSKASLECGHLEDADAVQKYLSAEYDLIIGDEAVQFDPDGLMEVMSRARTTNEAVIAAGGAEVWLVTNPGGPSHALLKDLFITKTPDVERYPALAAHYRPEEWRFIPATLDDNPYLDPAYETLALSGLRKARYEQLRHADWDVAEGQFFEEFSERVHVQAVTLARPLTGVVEAVDWGYTAPGCVGWFAPLGDNHWHCLAEWKFSRRTAEEVAQGIRAKRRELGVRHVAQTVVDPSMFNKTGHARGESFAETFARCGVPCTMGDRDRKMGWPRLQAWFRVSEAGRPWLTIDPDCRYLRRSIPGLLADPANPEDVDSSLDDHGADMLRYFVMSRPPLWRAEAQTRQGGPGTWGFWKRWHDRPSPKAVLAS